MKAAVALIAVKHRGSYSELVACAWLLAHGYEVFRNVSAHGIVDVVAMNDTEVLRLDIRTARNNAGTRLSDKQIKAGILRLLVFDDGTCVIEREPSRGTEITCAGCGAVFTASGGNVKRRKFCSSKCRLKFADAARSAQCKGCGEEFLYQPPVVQRFCSRQCRENSEVGALSRRHTAV